MQQEIPKPAVIIAIIAAVALAVYFGKSALSEPPTMTKEEQARFMPSWIDPVTYKPRAGATPSSGGTGQPTHTAPQTAAGPSHLQK